MILPTRTAVSRVMQASSSFCHVKAGAQFGRAREIICLHPMAALDHRGAGEELDEDAEHVDLAGEEQRRLDGRVGHEGEDEQNEER